jgi:hypothetical protein
MPYDRLTLKTSLHPAWPKLHPAWPKYRRFVILIYCDISATPIGFKSLHSVRSVALSYGTKISKPQNLTIFIQFLYQIYLQPINGF